jgi:hypothetical protein
VLDELADCFAFFLAILNKSEEISQLRLGESIIDSYEKEVQDVLTNLIENQEKGLEDPMDLVNNWILIIGAAHETEYTISTSNRFAIAIFIAMMLFEDITWEEITNAYRQKSKVNIDRQRGDY